eukprot:1432609-Rhodomonas_salina.7
MPDNITHHRRLGRRKRHNLSTSHTRGACAEQSTDALATCCMLRAAAEAAPTAPVGSRSRSSPCILRTTWSQTRHRNRIESSSLWSTHVQTPCHPATLDNATRKAEYQLGLLVARLLDDLGPLDVVEAGQLPQWARLVEDLHATATRTHEPTSTQYALTQQEGSHRSDMAMGMESKNSRAQGGRTRSDHTCETSCAAMRCWTPGTILRASSMFCLILSAARLLNGNTATSIVRRSGSYLVATPPESVRRA